MQLYKIDQYFEFHFSTQRFDTGAATDADALPTYRVYEENNDTVIANGDTSKVDDAGTTGYYKARAQVTSAAGYEVGKVYHVRVAATVNSVAGAGVVGSFTVLPALVYDSLVGGTDNLQVDAVSIANGVITAASIATGAIDADALATDAVEEFVLGLLKYDWTGITGEAARSVLNALRAIRNKWSITGTTLTVTKEDDSTAAWTSTLTTSAGAEPITASDPAGP